MRTPEGIEKDEIKKYLNEISAYQVWPVPTGYGPPLIDCFGCVRGKFFGIEVKREGVWKPSPRQKITLDRITAAGGLAFTTNSVERVKTMIGDHILGQERHSCAGELPELQK